MSIPLTVLRLRLPKTNLEPDVGALAPGPWGLHLPQAPSLARMDRQELPEDWEEERQGVSLTLAHPASANQLSLDPCIRPFQPFGSYPTPHCPDPAAPKPLPPTFHGYRIILFISHPHFQPSCTALQGCNYEIAIPGYPKVAKTSEGTKSKDAVFT